MIEHGPHWINFIILIFISEKKGILDIKKLKIISFDMENKRKSKANHRNESLVFLGGTPIML